MILFPQYSSTIHVLFENLDCARFFILVVLPLSSSGHQAPDGFEYRSLQAPRLRLSPSPRPVERPAAGARKRQTLQPAEAPGARGGVRAEGSMKGMHEGIEDGKHGTTKTFLSFMRKGSYAYA